MKYRILFFLFIIHITCDLDNQETSIVVKEPTVQEDTSNSTSDSSSGSDVYDTTADLNKIFFLNEEIGFIAGNGLVLKTKNGGENWVDITNELEIPDRLASDRFWDNTYNVKAIHFENESIGLIVGTATLFSCYCPVLYLYLTNNGGKIWELILRSTTPELRNIVGLYGNDSSKNIALLLNQDRGFYSEKGYVIFSNNTGEEWISKSLSYNTSSSQADYYNTPWITSSYLFENKILLTTKETNATREVDRVSQLETNFLNDGTTELQRNIISSSSEYFEIQDIFFNSEYSFLCGYNGLYSISSDLGENWTKMSIEGYEDQNFTSIHFNSNYEGILATDKGEILISSDNGQSWNLRYDLSKKINDIQFLNQKKFIVIGDDGLLEILDI